MTDENALRLLKHRRSALDYSIRELTRMGTLVPASEKVKIDAHVEAIRKIERAAQRQDQQSRDRHGVHAADDAPLEPHGRHRQQVRLHEPDNVQVGRRRSTSRWAGARGHHPRRVRVRHHPRCDVPVVAGHEPRFVRGPRPEPPEHHLHAPSAEPQGRRVPTSSTAARPAARMRYVWDAMVNANHWYFQKTADIINQFRTQIGRHGQQPPRSTP